MMRARRSIAALLLATTPGCTAFYVVSPAQYVPQNQPAEIFLTDVAGYLYVLEQPAIVGGNVTGLQRGTPDTVALPVSRVQEALVRKKSAARTGLLVGTLVLAGVGVVLSNRGGSGESCKLVWAQEDVPGKDSQCEAAYSGGGPAQ